MEAATQRKVTDRFLSIVSWTLEHEGYKSDHPSDPGGETIYGISKRWFPDEEIETPEDAIRVYRREFWERPKISKIRDYELARKVFDIGVPTGPGDSIRYLQQAANVFGAGLKVDGILGPITLGWVNGFRWPKALVSAFEIFAGQHFIAQGKLDFLAGWLIRLDE